MRAVACMAFATGLSASAQTPGQWQYTIVTDRSQLPADMRVNFPTVTFSVCRTQTDFSSGRAFALQTLASSEARCSSTPPARTPSRSGTFDTVQFSYACDGGNTLTGSASGRVENTRFTLAMQSKYVPSVNGVASLTQTMSAKRIGPCEVRPVNELGKLP